MPTGNAEHIAAALEWAVATLPEIASSYDYLPAGKSKALPDVICDLERETVAREDERFSVLVFQQVALRVYELSLSFMVDASPANPDDPASVEAAHKGAQQQLRSFGDRLVAAVLADHTLGGRVAAASPFIDVDYSAPFVEYQDGTRGREVRVSLAVAEPLIADE